MCIRDSPGLDGIEFTVTNRSAHKVLVDGEWREPGEAVATLTLSLIHISSR